MSFQTRCGEFSYASVKQYAQRGGIALLTFGFDQLRNTDHVSKTKQTNCADRFQKQAPQVFAGLL
jgi:hypothetical protein